MGLHLGPLCQAELPDDQGGERLASIVTIHALSASILRAPSVPPMAACTCSESHASTPELKSAGISDMEPISPPACDTKHAARAPAGRSAGREGMTGEPSAKVAVAPRPRRHA